MSALAPEIGRVFRCAWCLKAEPVPGGILYFAYTGVDAAGHRLVAVADAASWSRSDGICPAHLAAAQ